MRKIIIIAAALGLTGCAAGSLSYAPPGDYGQINNEKTINRPFDSVWASSIPALSKDFFVINNIDKDSGLINLSYSGDPQKYLDCGTVESEVSNAQGKRNYRFDGTSPYQVYEILSRDMIFRITRRMSLDGRINLIFEPIGEDQTKATANIRYAVTKKVSATPITGGYPSSFEDTVTFNTGSGASFPSKDDEGTHCVSTGKLERDILSAIK